MFYIATGIINHTTDQITRTFSNEYPNAMKFAPTGRACAASSIVMMPNYLENKSCANKSRYHIGYLPTCAGQQLPQPYPSSIVAPEQRKQLIVVIIVAAAFLLTLICLVIVVCLKY